MLAVAAALALVAAPSMAQTSTGAYGSPPECAPVDPALGVTIDQGDVVVFTIDCQDADGDLVGGTWFLDGNAFRTDTTTYPDTFVHGAESQIQVPFEDAGAWSVAFVGYDDRGASSQTVEWRVDVRPTASSSAASSAQPVPPSCARVTPTDPVTARRGDQPTFEAQCTDSNGDLLRVDWFLDDVLKDSKTAGSPTRANSDTTILLPDLARHEVKAVAFDSSGLRSAPATWTVDVASAPSAPAQPQDGIPSEATSSGGGLGWGAQFAAIAGGIAALVTAFVAIAKLRSRKGGSDE